MVWSGQPYRVTPMPTALPSIIGQAAEFPQSNQIARRLIDLEYAHRAMDGHLAVRIVLCGRCPIRSVILYATPGNLLHTTRP